MSKQSTRRTARRILSLLMVLVIVLSISVVPALAATSKTKSVTSNSGQLSKMTSFKVTSGKGLLYSLGLKKTTVTLHNNGNYYVAVYEKNAAGVLFYKGSLYGNETRTFTMSGSAKTTTLYFQKMRGNTSITVSVSAGSVS